MKDLLAGPRILCVALIPLFALVFSIQAQDFQELPLASVRYFNPYTNPTNWGGWGSYIYPGGGASVQNDSGTVPVANVGGTRALVLNSVNPPGGYWTVQFKISGNTFNYLRTGTNPAIHLRLQWSAIPTNGNWNMNIGIGSTSGNPTVPLKNYITASTNGWPNGWQDIYIPMSDFIQKSPSLDLTHVVLFSMAAAGNYSDTCVLDIAAIDLVPSALPAQDAYGDFIKVNQIGYAPLMPDKLAVVSWETNTIGTNNPGAFQIVNATNSQVVFTGTLIPFVQPSGGSHTSGWTLDGDTIYEANFGALQTPGVYQVEVPGLGAQSPPFLIATNVYQSLFRDALRFFYYSRSGVAIAEPYAEGFDRPALRWGNTNATYNYDPNKGNFNYGANNTRNVLGCWFDAGDTHIDMNDTTVACNFLLDTFRDFASNVPPYSLDLPESNSQQSDLVPLVDCCLDWIKLMQNPDGSVCEYIIDGPSSGTTQAQLVSDISSCGTAEAAGLFAKAYAVMGNTIPYEQSTDLLARAQLAWSWLQVHTSNAPPRLPEVNGVDGGGWDTSWGSATFDTACRAFAAVELFNATGDPQFNNYFTNQFSKNGNSPLSGSVWGSNKGGYSGDNVITYLFWPLNFAFLDYVESTQAVSTNVQATLESAFLHQANVLTNYAAYSGYHIPMLEASDLGWGSSGAILTPSAVVLARAFEWTGNTNYFQTAMQSLHFICGRNPVNRVFVSGYGEDYQHSSDQFSQFWTNLLQNPPGYLCGNINTSGSAVMVVQDAWKRFINTQDADMTEPDVTWNGAFTYLAGFAANDAMPPALQIAPAANGNNISWPLRSATFELDCSTNLGPAAVWTPVANQPALSNGVWRVSVPTSNAASAFYRLSYP